MIHIDLTETRPSISMNSHSFTLLYNHIYKSPQANIHAEVIEIRKT